MVGIDAGAILVGHGKATRVATILAVFVAVLEDDVFYDGKSCR